MSFHEAVFDDDGLGGDPTQPDARAEQFPAWEMIETGRYRPRRIRGSLRGRELG